MLFGAGEVDVRRGAGQDLVGRPGCAAGPSGAPGAPRRRGHGGSAPWSVDRRWVGFGAGGPLAGSVAYRPPASAGAGDPRRPSRPGRGAAPPATDHVTTPSTSTTPAAPSPTAHPGAAVAARGRERDDRGVRPGRRRSPASHAVRAAATRRRGPRPRARASRASPAGSAAAASADHGREVARVGLRRRRPGRARSGAFVRGLEHARGREPLVRPASARRAARAPHPPADRLARPVNAQPSIAIRTTTGAAQPSPGRPACGTRHAAPRASSNACASGASAHAAIRSAHCSRRRAAP